MYSVRTLLVAAAVWTTVNVTVAQAEIKVGIAGPLSGSTINLGEQQEIGAQKAFDHLSAEGGVLGEEIVVTSVNDACEPKQAEATAWQLVDQGVIFVVGHACSGASLAASKFIKRPGSS